ncbi:MAG TPA: CapA family protein [Myxococcaceae bacterium]|nr:CapA family protein [Myxococcaceae bacterium]
MRAPVLAPLAAALIACAGPSTLREPATRLPEEKPSSAASPIPTPAQPEVRQPEVPQLEPDAHLEAGRAALRQKNGALAVGHLRACVAQQPENVECLWQLGWAHSLLGEWDAVIERWERVKALRPDHPEVAGRLADARAQRELQLRMDEAARRAPAALPAPALREFSLRIRAVGDVMLGTDFPAGFLPPEDGAEVLAGVQDWLRDADVTFVNLEGPLCDDPRPSDKCRRGGNCYAFRTPTRYVQYLVDAGVDLASTANNHSGDFGETCRRETEAALDRAGIKWSGAPGSIATLEARGFRVALVAFHTSTATNDVNDHPAAEALIKAAAASHDLVVVSFHGGAEGARALHVPMGEERFYGENRGDLRKFTHLAVDAGADLVIGHGPHVLRGMEIYRDRLITYSLGNFATYGRFNLTGAMGVGAVLEAILDGEGRFVSGRILPTRQMGEGVTEKDRAGTALKYVRMLSAEDFPETGVMVDADGVVGVRQGAAAANVPATAP